MIVTLLNDYGRDDELVGVCHGVIATIAPQARVIDVTHGIPRFGVRQGALALRDTLPFMPAGVLILYEDAYRHLALAINRGDAARTLGLGDGAELRLAPG